VSVQCAASVEVIVWEQFWGELHLGCGDVRGVMYDERVAWEVFQRTGPVSEDGARRGVGVAGREVASALTGDNSARSSLASASTVIKINHTQAKNIILRSDLLDDIQETARCGLRASVAVNLCQTWMKEDTRTSALLEQRTLIRPAQQSHLRKPHPIL
jgi:hypothetical protein